MFLGAGPAPIGRAKGPAARLGLQPVNFHGQTHLTPQKLDHVKPVPSGLLGQNALQRFSTSHAGIPMFRRSTAQSILRLRRGVISLRAHSCSFSRPPTLGNLWSVETGILVCHHGRLSRHSNKRADLGRGTFPGFLVLQDFATALAPHGVGLALLHWNFLLAGLDGGAPLQCCINDQTLIQGAPLVQTQDDN